MGVLWKWFLELIIPCLTAIYICTNKRSHVFTGKLEDFQYVNVCLYIYIYIFFVLYRLQTIFTKFDEVRDSGNMILSNITGEYERTYVNHQL